MVLGSPCYDGLTSPEASACSSPVASVGSCLLHILFDRGLSDDLDFTISLWSESTS